MLIPVNVLLHSYIGLRSCKAAKFQIWIYNLLPIITIEHFTSQIYRIDSDF